MRTKAFTLIEVMVVMAIISILAGMMVPAVWKFWESEEIATTRTRMKELKIAMVGDRSLVQNGTRTHFGFVGDFGELPFDNTSSCSFKFLNSNADMSGSRYDAANWSGRYLSSSADAASYDVDAWGKQILCTKKIYTDDRWVGLTLASVAPNGELLEEVIDINDIIPTNRVTGNVFGVIVNPASLKITVLPSKSGVFSPMQVCKQLNGFSSYTTLLPYKLPIGRSLVELELSNNNADCSLPVPTVKNSFNYFTQDNLQVIKVPDLNIP